MMILHVIFYLGIPATTQQYGKKTLNKICAINALSAGHEAKCAGSSEGKGQSF